MNKKNIPAISESDALISEIHQVEEKIDQFIADHRRQAEELLSAARQESERLQAAGRAEAERAAAQLKEDLLLKAREESAALATAGQRSILELDKDIGPRKEQALRLVMDLLLGKNR